VSTTSLCTLRQSRSVLVFLCTKGLLFEMKFSSKLDIVEEWVGYVFQKLKSLAIS
jgi:hypothetical protein